MEANKIANEVAAVVREYGKLSGEIPNESDLYADLGVESVNSIAILMALEERFSLTLDDAKFIQARTLTSLVSLVSDSMKGN